MFLNINYTIVNERILFMNYKQLERDAKLGDYHAQQVLEERREKLEKLPIRDALGYSLTWCP